MEQQSYATRSGVRIAADVSGPPDGPPVVLLHGGGQTRRSWGGTQRLLAGEGYHVVNMDMRGHGETGWASDRDYTMETFAQDVRDVASTFDRPVAFVGASMGGLAAVLAAGESPMVECSALVLVDVTPHFDPDGRARILNFMQRGLDGFATLDEVADAVSDYLPHRPRPDDLSGLAHSVWRDDDGRLRWHWDPHLLDPSRIAAQDRSAARFEDAARAVAAPVLLVRGGSSEVVRPQDAEAFRRAVPQAEYAEVARAAHMVAGDRNEAFSRVVTDFLGRHLEVAASHAQNWSSTS